MPPAPAPGALADPAQQAQPTPAPATATPVPAAPAPAAPVVHEAATVKPVAHVEEAKPAAAEIKAKESAAASAKTEPKESAKTAAATPEPKAAPTAAATKPAEPAASSKTAPPAPEPANATGKVTVPHTDHVHLDVPKGLQHWLDADTRMQPWVNKVVSVADACYERERKENPKAAGVIPVKIKMHENERPDADVGSVPSSLGAVIACATTKLMGSRPPLFTGKEGDSYTVKIHFDK
jgi:hypothetical protein